IGRARNIWLDGEIRDMIRRSADTSAARCSLGEIRAGERPGCSVDELVQTIEARRRLPLGWHADAIPLSRGLCPEGDVARRARDEARRVAGDASRTVEERTEADVRLKRAETQLATACAPRAMDYVLWVLGIALTVAALSLFTPFWFDLLKRFVMMRGAGNPPAAERG